MFSESFNQPDQKQRIFKEIENKLQKTTPSKSIEPSIEFEQTRRRVKSNNQELWNFINSEILNVQKKLPPNDSVSRQSLDNILSIADEHKRSIANDMENMKKMDGYESWRIDEAKSLSDLVQKRLTYLQNPSDCNSARKLVCKLNKGCGYGCQLHHVVYCFIMAYATERTLILKSKGWRYHKNGWEEVFKPISDTCIDSTGGSHGSWPAQANTQVITLPIIDSLNPRPSWLPLAIPLDLAPRLMRLHGDPIVWWVGQFLKYLLKTQPETEEMLNNGIEKLGFKGPIVG